MKKKVIGIGMAILMLFCTLPIDAVQGVIVLLNGDELVFDVQPVIIENRTLVPMRLIFERLGASIQWDEEMQTVTAVTNEKTIVLVVGSKVAIVNGETYLLDVEPFVQSGRTMVPLRFISEMLDAQVDWVEETQTVIITKKEQADQEKFVVEENQNRLIYMYWSCGIERMPALVNVDENMMDPIYVKDDYINGSCMKSYQYNQKAHEEYLKLLLADGFQLQNEGYVKGNTVLCVNKVSESDGKDYLYLIATNKNYQYVPQISDKVNTSIPRIGSTRYSYEIEDNLLYPAFDASCRFSPCIESLSLDLSVRVSCYDMSLFDYEVALRDYLVRLYKVGFVNISTDYFKTGEVGIAMTVPNVPILITIQIENDSLVVTGMDMGAPWIYTN